VARHMRQRPMRRAENTHVHVAGRILQVQEHRGRGRSRGAGGAVPPRHQHPAVELAAHQRGRREKTPSRSRRGRPAPWRPVPGENRAPRGRRPPPRGRSAGRSGARPPPRSPAAVEGALAAAPAPQSARRRPLAPFGRGVEGPGRRDLELCLDTWGGAPGPRHQPRVPRRRSGSRALASPRSEASPRRMAGRPRSPPGPSRWAGHPAVDTCGAPHRHPVALGVGDQALR